MTVVELRPLGVKCNIACKYCYQNPQREAGNVLHRYDLDAMFDAIEREGGQFALFGGEPLLMPLPDLEKLWKWGFERNGSNSIQTNGALITDEHVLLFKRYNVHVGLSIDGPGELNAARWAGSDERTRQTTNRIEQTIERLCAEQLFPTLIVTLHRGNATAEKLDTMCAWLLHLESLGIRRVRLHLLEVDSQNVRDTLAMSSDENRFAIRRFADMQKELKQLQLDLFEDQRRMLLGDDDGVTCVWGACDPYTTAAVRGVEGNGQSSNCGRTNKDGIDFPKANSEGFERYLALYHTPQEHGGCGGCRFFVFCKGQCPGTGLDGDWRNRSEHCATWYESYERVEAEMLAAGQQPLSLSPMRARLEQFFLSAWESGKNTTLNHALRVLAQKNSLPVLRTETFQQPDTQRLGFRLPTSLRINWTSDRAKESWADRFDELKRAVNEMQWRCVGAQVRRCAIVQHDETEPWRELGLASHPIDKNRVVVGLQPDLIEFQNALKIQASDALADLLGQPRCCSSWWRRTWIEENWSDPIWPMASASGSIEAGDHGQLITASGSYGTNPFWRSLGLFLNPHVPCKLDCESADSLGQAIADTATQLGMKDSVDQLKEILSWPVEWTSLHGISETRSPIMRLVSRTDATVDRKVVRFVPTGCIYPAEGATGIRFPFRTPDQTQIGNRVKQPTGQVAKAIEVRSVVPPILVESLAATEISEADLRIEKVCLTPYFTVVRLSNGQVGAAMSYYRYAAELSVQLPKVTSRDPLWIDWLFHRANPESVFEAASRATKDEAACLLNSLRVAVVSALNAKALQSGGANGYCVSEQPPADLFDPVGLAVVIGFGGYIDRWAAGSQLEHLHICDLGYRSRRVEMDAALRAYSETWPDKRFTVSDGSDTQAVLSKADYVAITASALANGTMESLLSFVRKDSYIVVQGQSGAIHPAPLLNRGVHCVATTIKPFELSVLADLDSSGKAMRKLLEGGLPWIYLTSDDVGISKNVPANLQIAE